MEDLKPAQQQPQDDQNKTTKEFNKNMKKLVALFGGKQAFARVSVPNEGIGDIVEELLKERREQAIDAFKIKAKEILDKKVEFDREVKKAEEELKNKVIAKQKEFSEAMKNLFQMVENINSIETSYYNSISDVANATDDEE